MSDRLRVADIAVGDILFAFPPPINTSGVPLTQTTSGDIRRHPVIVFEVELEAKTISGYMLQSFGGAGSLTQTKGLAKDLHKWFLPVHPAKKEPGGIHEPLLDLPGPGKAQWVNLKDYITIAEENITKKLPGEVSETLRTKITAARDLAAT